MNAKRFLIKLQYLGLRFHGVQKLALLPSIQERVEKALGEKVKTKFSSRTDALVSAEENYCLAMFEEEFKVEAVKRALEKLPPDIRVLEVKAVPVDYAILDRVLEKEYHYYFAFGESSLHPFCAPYMTLIQEKLDIELMKKGAALFCGTHSFINYAYKPKPGTVFERTISSCEISPNTLLSANFFPEKSYIFKVRGKGFLRGQVRMMMGALFRLGLGEMTLSDLEESLKMKNPHFVRWAAPGSGLILHQTILE